MYLADHEILFQERCAWTGYYDTIWLEWIITKDFDDWIWRRLSDAKKDDNKSQERFWEKEESLGS